MPVAEIDTWAKRIVGVAAPDIRRAVGEVELESELVSEVYLQVKQVLSRLDSPRLAEPANEPWLVEQLALAIYLAVATSETRRRATPGLLTSLNKSLARALSSGTSAATSPSPSNSSEGGTS